MPKRDARGRFLRAEPGGGDSGGGKDTVADGLRKRLAALLADPGSAPKDITRLVRTLAGAVRIELMERQIAIADVKLNRRTDRLEDLVDDAERRAEGRARSLREGTAD